MQLKTKIEKGKFVLLAEMEPPKGADATMMLENAEKIRGAIDAFVVPEMSNAVMRMSSLGGSVLLQQRGLDVVMQINCRDRNRLALQADILAAYACGITSIMAVEGVAPSFGDHHETRAVYDIRLNTLLTTIQTLQKGHDMAGVDLIGAPKFAIGTTINPGTAGIMLDKELAKMEEQIDSGVQFFITPPLFDINAIEPFLKRIDNKRSFIIPTILLLKSVGMARYMDRNVEHVHIPAELIKRIQKAPDKARECISVSKEMVEMLKKESFCGAMISTIGWENKLPEILGVM
ncbi:MAG: 5,10-methylenetetrahydrofolate reductase [Desulfobacteraceae bacterium 4572_19]|nr:MAG: 5,10-methylenetetrahydrofolate reductase [Desulfobacteraceae bacterium 4572_19]